MNLTESETKNRTIFSAQESLNEYSQFHLFPIEEKLIQKYFARPGRILDLGCGCGRISLFLRDMGHEVVGIDIVPKMLALARELVPGVTFELMDACELKFDTASFDYVIFSFNGIDCISPESKRIICFNEIRRILKFGQPFIFSTHNAFSLKTLFPTNRFRLHNLLLNLQKLRVFKAYRFERHPAGILEIHYTTFFKQKTQLQKCGFKNILAYGQNSDSIWAVKFLDPWSYYACIKA